jgi:hypothetical protein
MSADGFDSAAGVLRRALVLGALAAAAIAVVAGLIGLLVAGGSGLLSGLVGASFALVFLGVTALSLMIAGRFSGLGTNAFFAALLAGWLVKFVVFLVAMLALRDQPWVQPYVLFGAIVSTVLSSLVVDAVVVGRARIPLDTSRR